jgi:hypothetical protein
MYFTLDFVYICIYHAFKCLIYILGLYPCVATGALKCITMLVLMCHYIGTNP